MTTDHRAPADSGEAPLRLPNGERVLVAGTSSDLSVFGPLKVLDGDWEPHLRACFARLVRRDWTCLDIGANIGAHTLGLASLAGSVIAFEAADRNAAHLRFNVDRSADAGRVKVANLALWDAPAWLSMAAAEEVEGCTFVASGDAADSLTRLRANIPSVAERELNLTLDAVEAMRLDDWLDVHPVRRLDLIKLDVEGSERRVLRGARRTLDWFRPILITEYNPGCATRYFGEPADAYFHDLRVLFSSIRLIEQDGTPSEPIADWETLAARLSAGKGWEDLLCEH
ncbi:FkbM family methyltransferase [Methylobacterium thuringiense]|uniref:Methyltransferase FkbM domain-containing protein n=1 Tax=Methylobacterium thuringiense TaxID=1003091 RepID=A0ABQ4TNY5_9HYPH|nr:FkbM family methyltransferase [Methylobacterium thuringiense]GJE55822.1 hypothetical protein EKPJFOCH_2318 [Methylobacterium thuringiense]